MKTPWYVSAALGLALLCLSGSTRAAEDSGDMPTEVRTDVQRIYPLGEKFDRKHIQVTCESQSGSRFHCFKTTYDKVIKEREPTVTGYVLLLSIGTVVLAEERQKILDAGRAESETESELQRNTLDTAELLIETLERVAKKAHVIAVEKPVAENLRSTLLSRAESVLKQSPRGRKIASLSSVPPSGGKPNEERREALLERLSGLSPK
jgi:hypothetical protein